MERRQGWGSEDTATADGPSLVATAAEGAVLLLAVRSMVFLYEPNIVSIDRRGRKRRLDADTYVVSSDRYRFEIACCSSRD